MYKLDTQFVQITRTYLAIGRHHPLRTRTEHYLRPKNNKHLTTKCQMQSLERYQIDIRKDRAGVIRKHDHVMFSTKILSQNHFNIQRSMVNENFKKDNDSLSLLHTPFHTHKKLENLNH